MCKPSLAANFKTFAHSFKNIAASATGLHCERPGENGEIVYKITPANVATSMAIDARIFRTSDT